MSYQEWRDLPWWVRQVYIDGLQEEEILLQVEPSWENNPLGTSVEGIREQGFTVIQGG